MLSRSTSFAVLVVAALSSPAECGWVSLGSFPPPRREGAGLVFASDQGTASVTVVNPGVIRVRFMPRGPLGRDHSYAVVQHPEGDPTLTIEVGKEASTLATSTLRVVVRHDPLRIAFEDAKGDSLDEDDAERGTAFAGSEIRVWKRLTEDARVYGFGEKAGSLEVRGSDLHGASYTMWNTDAYGWGPGRDPLYASVPVFMVVRKGIAHGIFLDNTFRSHFDVGHETPDLLSFGVEGGELNYYFIVGPSPKNVIEHYTELTGRNPLPPLWALGFHQCRYSYYPDSKVRFIAQSFRARHIPADTLWLDIHHLDSFKPLTWDPARFPDPPKLISDLRAQGFRLVTIVDPHPKKERGYPPYDSGLKGDHFVKRADGSTFEAPVWPSRAAHDPGPSVFPDFSRPATREWWGGLYRSLVDAGVSGVWNDMDEPAVFNDPWHTMPLDLRHDNEGQPTTHSEIHNVYGMLVTRATYEGLLRLRPNARPFVLTRATFAGGQRYAAVWTGDNASDWSHLRESLPMIGSMSVSGFPFVGADIGGFVHGATAELFTRWLQVGIFSPFMRAHTDLGNPDQEPWSYGNLFEEANRHAIELRYELLPYLYTAFEEASRTGIPPFRPLFLEYPQDPKAAFLEDEFLFGASLLVAPVLLEGARERRLYLPEGEWYDYWTGTRVSGGREITVPVVLESIPLFVRAGGIIFGWPVLQNTEERVGKPLIVTLYPSPRSEAELYEDDGEGFGYQHGVFLRRLFAQDRSPGACTIHVGAAQGTYRPASRDLILHLRGCGEAVRVAVDGKELLRLATEGLDPTERGWTRRGDDLVVRVADRWDAFTITAPEPPRTGAGGSRTGPDDVLHPAISP